MNRINAMTKRARPLLGALALAGMAVGATAPAAAPNPAPGWLWLSSTVTDCTFTATVNWANFKGAKTLQVFVTQTYNGTALVPSFAALRNKDNTATVTLAPLAPAPTSDNFYVWAQLLDSHGVAIPSSLDFAGVQVAFCTAP